MVFFDISKIAKTLDFITLLRLMEMYTVTNETGYINFNIKYTNKIYMTKYWLCD